MKILLVEDDKSLADLLAEYLTQEHYAVDVATDGESAWQYGLSFVYDLILLDVLLPKQDGISLCRQFRSHGCRTPILLLTARNSSMDKIKGLDAGADDYLVKPFDFEELTARIRALLRRDNQTLPPVLQWGSLCLNPSTCEVTYADRILHLTPKEYALLELFLRNYHRVYSSSEIIDRVWSSQETPGEDTVRTHIKELRRKLKAAGAPSDLIKTVYGQGYCLKSLTEGQIPSGKKREDKEKETQTDAYLAAIIEAWDQCKGEIIGRLRVLDLAANVLKEGALSKEIQQQAKFEAHSLVGTLGTFGFAQGSRLARELENLLQTEVQPEHNRERMFATLLKALREEMNGKPRIESTELTQEKSPLLLVIDDDTEFSIAVAALAKVHGIDTAMAPIGSLSKVSLTQKHPDVVLVQLNFEKGFQLQHLELIELISHQKPSLPIIGVADRGNLEDRIAAIGRGVQIFLEQPVTPERAIEVVKQALVRNHIGAKVMVVDDDLQLLKTLPIILKPWGFKQIALEDPRQFWDVLKAVEPDLLVLDIEMPYVDGIQLCRVLRSDPRWNRLPVLFLSAHTDPQTQERVFACGADDFVSKPVVAAELANRIINRLERSEIVA